VRSKNKKMFDISDLISKLLVSELGDFLLPIPSFINFVGNNWNLTLLYVAELEKNQINMKRLEEMGRSTNIRSINVCQRKQLFLEVL